MWRFTLLCSVLTLTVACGDGPGAPSVNTDVPSLQFEGDPPPPPLEGRGSVTFGSDAFAATGSEEGIEGTEIVTQQECVPPTFPSIPIEGDYTRNPSNNSAGFRFSPVAGFGKGRGVIHETANPANRPLFERQDASGTLVLMSIDFQQYEVHLENYDGATLIQEGSFGGITGELTAVVMVKDCSKVELTGVINYFWFPPGGGKF